MGVIKRGILGGFSGKIGNIVGSSWKGIAVIKSLPLSVANPDTVAQQAQRNAMSKSVEFAKILLVPIIATLWNRFAQGMSGYNHWVKENISNIDANGFINSALAKMAIGKMGTTTMTNVKWFLGSQKIALDWNPLVTGAYQTVNDPLYIVAYNETTKEFQAHNTAMARITGTVQIDSTYPLTTGDVVKVWTMFRTPNGYYVSNSVYQAAVETP